MRNKHRNCLIVSLLWLVMYIIFNKDAYLILVGVWTVPLITKDSDKS